MKISGPSYIMIKNFKLFLIIGVILMSSTVEAKVSFIDCADSRLNQTAKSVEPTNILSDEIQKLIFDMLELSGYEANPKSNYAPRLVGLAAPQVGVMKRVIVVDTGFNIETRSKHNLQAFINPEIIWKSDETSMYPEGCYSVPKEYAGVTNRADAVVVEAYNTKGEKIRERYEGYTARVFQHECEHLDGVRFPMLLKNHNYLHFAPLEQSERATYRNNWKTWDKVASQETLENFQKGIYN